MEGREDAFQVKPLLDGHHFAPRLLEEVPVVVGVEALVTRQESWHRAHVPGALLVGPAPHGIEAGVRTPQVSSYQRQIG